MDWFNWLMATSWAIASVESRESARVHSALIIQASDGSGIAVSMIGRCVRRKTCGRRRDT
ncbi:MAG: hypothetical protein A2579_08655 [Lysobacterales bacterium RIFOXYD1_FULL_69_11]|nr:MAG: hypothetical protein A2190_01725 [Xanthomonadales bacterium RIFOXYA1_FULL_69_10]OHE87618.1 MAG: hypothetical protein A2579_08655 [Xanthomonadales bacterium RIFOXYD1_FULL_69_11]